LLQPDDGFILNLYAIREKKGKREYLNDSQTNDLTKQLNEYFESRVEVPRTRVGKEQTIETLINEEALLFSNYLREKRNMDAKVVERPFLSAKELI